MELSALQAFVKVVQTGSFTRAADALQTQKAHISRVVSQLEKNLGVRLLERSTRALSLTEIGREFYERAVGILGAVDDAERAVQRAQAEPRGILRLTCSEAFGVMAVSRWIDHYLKRYPLTRVEADFTSRLVDIVHEGFDLAVRVGRLEDSRLSARKLGEIRYGLYASSQYLEGRALPQTPAELSTHVALSYLGSSERSTWQFEHNGQTVRIDIRPRLKINHVLAVRDAAVAGQGLAVLPDMAVYEAVQAGQLQRLLPEWSLPSIPVHAVYPSARYLTPKVRAFIDLSLEQLQPLQGMD